MYACVRDEKLSFEISSVIKFDFMWVWEWKKLISFDINCALKSKKKGVYDSLKEERACVYAAKKALLRLSHAH
jgi:hypothetical protein